MISKVGRYENVSQRHRGEHRNRKGSTRSSSKLAVIPSYPTSKLCGTDSLEHFVSALRLELESVAVVPDQQKTEGNLACGHAATKKHKKVPE